jgi:hypothetical protein
MLMNWKRLMQRRLQHEYRRGCMKLPTLPRGLMDPAFKYRRAAETDVAATFARIRRQQKAEAEAANRQPANVKPLTRKAK